MTQTPPAGLDGTTFVSTSTEGHDLVEGSTIRLSFADGRLAVRAGCNTMSAAYDVTDGRLAWSGPPMGTRMACPEDLMAQDTWLAGLIEQGLDATVDGDGLTLTTAEVTLHLERE